jgi:hypothetical protein
MTEHNPNLAIWSAVSTPDPARTKPFKGKGGFEGTAINAVYLAKRATEIFGPMGIGWGVDIVEEKLLQGGPMISKEGEILGNEVIHCLRISLWYKRGEDVGRITHFGQTTFVGQNKFGVYTDEDAPKKSLTDAMTKALSLLGFAADVHMGMFDDHKYIAEVRQEYAEKTAAQAKRGGDFEKLTKSFEACDTPEKLDEWLQEEKPKLGKLRKDWQDTFGEIVARHFDTLLADVTTRAEHKAWSAAWKPVVMRCPDPWIQLWNEARKARWDKLPAETPAPNGHAGNGSEPKPDGPPPPSDPEKYIEWMERAIAAAPTPAAVQNIQDDFYVPVADELLPPDREIIEKALERRLTSFA